MNKIESNFLSNLLPYETDAKKNAELKKGLKEYQALLKASLEANSHFQNKDLERLDALVGENACQIRTDKAIIASKNATTNDFNDRIVKALQKMDLLLNPNRIEPLMRSSVSLKSILASEEINISLTDEQDFVIQSFLLTEIKTATVATKTLNSIYRIEASDPKKICRFGDITLSFARSLVAKARKNLASASVQFVRTSACQLQDPSLIRMISEEFTVTHNGLSCIPMFWTYKTILHTAQKEGIPLLIHVKFLEKEANDEYSIVDEEHMLFQSTENKCFAEVNTAQADLKQPAFVVQGVACAQKGESSTKAQWKETMRKISPVDVILAGAADHRQYPDAAQDSLIEKLADSEYENYKTQAQSNGFSDKNPSTFFIQHVYAARIEKIVNEISQSTGHSALTEKSIIPVVEPDRAIL